MTEYYRADHLGSLLRPAEVLEARASYEAATTSLEALREVEDNAISRALQLQKEAGMDVFTDGEYRRGSFLSGPAQWLEGFAAPSESFLREWHGPDGGLVPTRVQVVAGKLDPSGRFTGHESAYMRLHSPGPIKITMPAASLLGHGAFKEGFTDRFYESPAEVQQDLSRIVNNELRSVVEEGIPYVQLDAPNYATRFFGERRSQQLREQGLDIEKEIEDSVRADNACLEGLPREGVTLGFHLCRGNHRSRWQTEGAYDPVAERLFSNLQVDRFLLEYDTERSGGFEPLRFIPPGKVVVLGLITTKEGTLESQDLLLRRIEEASRYVPVENLALSPQCGFASIDAGNLLTWDDQRRKLELVSDTARKVWG